MTDEKRVNRRMINKMIGGGILSLLTGGAYVAENEGYTDFVPDEQENSGGAGGAPRDEGPVYVDRDGFQNAYEELSDAEQMSFMSDEQYQDMFDGREDDIIAAYFDFNPSEDKTDSSFKYFFVDDIDNYVNEQGEFDYSALGSEDLRMGSTSWSNTSDSVAKTFEKYGTRNKQDIPDMLEGGLE